jgi:hypothetical protein
MIERLAKFPSICNGVKLPTTYLAYVPFYSSCAYNILYSSSPFSYSYLSFVLLVDDVRSYRQRPEPRIPICSVTIIPVRTRVASLCDV